MELVTGAFSFVFLLLIPIAFLLIMRLFGAWMFRIDEVINSQKEILIELKKLSSKKE